MQLIETLRERPDLWDLFTRKEEYEDGIRDKYDRFPYFLSRERSILEPVVSAFLYEKGFHPSYPEGKRFAVCLSHDIDFLYEAPETKLIKAIQSFVARDMRQSWSHLRQMPNSYPLLEFRRHHLIGGALRGALDLLFLGPG